MLISILRQVSIGPANGYASLDAGASAGIINDD